MKILVAMRREGEGRQAGFGDVDAEFLLQLANEGRLGRLVAGDLAAGKFPQTSHRLAGWALGQQYAAIGVDECDTDDAASRQLSCDSCH